MNKDKKIDDVSSELFKIEFYRQVLMAANDLDFVGIEEVRKEIEELFKKHIKKNLKKQEKILHEIAKEEI